MTSPTLPDAAGPFTLSLTLAAQVLNMTSVELLDLTRSGCALALLVPPSLTTDRPPLRYAPGLLADIRARLESRTDELRAAEIRVVAAALRAYLTERPPLEVYDQAVNEGRPVLGRNNSGHILAHVQWDALVSWVQRAAPLAGPAAHAAMPSHASVALERLGCTQVRGVRAVGDGRQRWHTWWRVPRSMWSPTGQWDSDIADWPALQDGPLAAVPDGQ